jgi:hypothetical protein
VSWEGLNKNPFRYFAVKPKTHRAKKKEISLFLGSNLNPERHEYNA